MSETVKVEVEVCKSDLDEIREEARLGDEVSDSALAKALVENLVERYFTTGWFPVDDVRYLVQQE